MYTHLSYIPQGIGSYAKAKAFLGYIAQRPGRNEEEIERILFGHGGALSAEQADGMIQEAAKNTYFWRLILSPDPATEDKDKNLDMWDLTREAVMWLEGRLGKNGIPRDIPFIGAEHRYDHTEIKHVHAILLIKRYGREMMITPLILDQFREAVKAKALSQSQAQERVVEQESQREQTAERAHALPQMMEQPAHAYSAPVSLSPTPEISLVCPMCGVGAVTKRLNSRVYECRKCGYAIKKGVILQKGRGREEYGISR